LELQDGKEKIAVSLIQNISTCWNSSFAMLQHAYRLRPVIWPCIKCYPEFAALYITSDEWAAVDYLLQVLSPFNHWTLWMSKRYAITLHKLIKLYNDIFNHIEDIIGRLKGK
jgi:hypothetical protein